MGEKFQRVTILPVCVREGQKITALGGAGIVDQNVEHAEFTSDLLDQLRRRVVPAQSITAIPARLPHLPIAAAVSSSAARSRPTSITSQPSAASASAMPRPMPRLDPVTSAVLPFSPSSIMHHLFHSIFNPSFCTNAAHLPSSRAMLAAYSSGVLGVGSAPSSINRFFISSDARIARSSLLSR